METLHADYALELKAKMLEPLIMEQLIYDVVFQHYDAKSNFQCENTSGRQEKSYKQRISVTKRNREFFENLKGGFHQPLGLRNTISRGSRGEL